MPLRAARALGKEIVHSFHETEAAKALKSAAAAFVKGLPEGDFASVFAQAESLPEGPARSRLAQEAYKTWFGKAPEAAVPACTGEC